MNYVHQDSFAMPADDRITTTVNISNKAGINDFVKFVIEATHWGFEILDVYVKKNKLFNNKGRMIVTVKYDKKDYELLLTLLRRINNNELLTQVTL